MKDNTCWPIISRWWRLSAHRPGGTCGWRRHLNLCRYVGERVASHSPRVISIMVTFMFYHCGPVYGTIIGQLLNSKVNAEDEATVCKTCGINFQLAPSDSCQKKCGWPSYPHIQSVRPIGNCWCYPILLFGLWDLFLLKIKNILNFLCQAATNVFMLTPKISNGTFG